MEVEPQRELGWLRGRFGVIAAMVIALIVVVGLVVVGTGSMRGLGIAQGRTIEGSEFGNAAREGAKPVGADDIRDLVAEFGEPPDATFARLRIPRLGIDAGVSPRYVDGLVMPLPDGPQNIAWYDMSNFPGTGGVPGGGGNAIFATHVDFNNQVAYADRHFAGPAIFYSLDHLGPGDVIEVDYDGQTLAYQVTWVEYLDAVTADWRAIWSNDVATDSITLFTCGGTFDRDAHAYSHRLVIRAERM